MKMLKKFKCDGSLTITNKVSKLFFLFAIKKMDFELQSVLCRICGSTCCDNLYNLFDSIILNDRKVNFCEMLKVTTQINVIIKNKIIKISFTLSVVNLSL